MTRKSIYTHTDTTVVDSEGRLAMAHGLVAAMMERRIPTYSAYFFNSLELESEVNYLKTKNQTFDNSEISVADALDIAIDDYNNMAVSEGVNYVLWHCLALRFAIENDLTSDDMKFVSVDAYYDTAQVSNTGSNARIYIYDFQDDENSVLFRTGVPISDPFKARIVAP